MATVANLNITDAHIVGVDETGLNDLSSLPVMGYSRYGVPAEHHDVQTTPGSHVTVIAPITKSGGANTEHCLIVYGSVGKEVFYRWVEHLVRADFFGRFPDEANSVLLIDNWSGHEITPLRDLLATVGAVVLCNAPKYFEFQPAEGAFHVFKASLRRNGQAAFLANPILAISQALMAVTPAVAAGLIRGCRIYPSADASAAEGAEEAELAADDDAVAAALTAAMQHIPGVFAGGGEDEES